MGRVRVRLGQMAIVEDSKDRRFQDGFKDDSDHPDGEDPSVALGRIYDHVDPCSQDCPAGLDRNADSPARNAGPDAELHGPDPQRNDDANRFAGSVADGDQTLPVRPKYPHGNCGQV